MSLSKFHRKADTLWRKIRCIWNNEDRRRRAGDPVRVPLAGGPRADHLSECLLWRIYHHQEMGPHSRTLCRKVRGKFRGYPEPP